MSQGLSQNETRTPATRRSVLLRAALPVVGLVALGLVFRWAVVASWHAPAGDGVQYHQLSQELSRAGRYAFGPEPAPLTYVRLPGYPLFLARVAVREAGLAMEPHLVRATRWNAALDVATALLVFLLLRERRLGLARWVAPAAMVGVLVCPLMLLLSSYGLSEALSTLGTTAVVLFLVRGMSRRTILYAALAGGVLGILQLTRADTLALVPPAMLAILLGEAPWRRRAAALAVCFCMYGLVFSPWPIRNLMRFGAAHPLGASWAAQDGRPLPTGAMRWMRTWGTNERRGEYLIYLLANNSRLKPVPNTGLIPAAWDSAEERRRLVALMDRFNEVHLAPEVDEGFRALAREREARAPLRTFLTLPWKRVAALWTSPNEEDFPMRSRLLHLPAWRPAFRFWDRAMLALAVLGMGVFWRGGRGSAARRLLAVIATAVAIRTLVFCYVHPFPVERYVVELFPLLIALGACGVGGAARAWAAWRARTGTTAAAARA